MVPKKALQSSVTLKVSNEVEYLLDFLMKCVFSKHLYRNSMELDKVGLANASFKALGLSIFHINLHQVIERVELLSFSLISHTDNYSNSCVKNCIVLSFKK